ncbi:MAG: M1 family aminopeptidase [Fimbriimonadaceae bacterium]|nr:M1 family aminopeptidase [Fimbriimonadaceae bacterium]
MHPALLICLSTPQTRPDVERLSQLAAAKNVAEISRLLAPGQPLAERHLRVLTTNGAYDTGRFGWTAVGSSDGRFAVLTTKITSEDVGEFLLEQTPKGWRYHPETARFPVRIGRHRLAGTFEIDTITASFKDTMTFAADAKGKGKPNRFNLRLSPHYRVSSLKTAAGESVPFQQLGGVILPARAPKVGERWTIAYRGVVDLPQYAGSISKTEISLTNDYWYPLVGRLPAAYDLTVRVPDGWTAVGQGVRVATSEPNTAQFRMDLPVVYFSFAAGPYRVESRMTRGKTYRTWSPRLGVQALKDQADIYPDIVDTFERALGKWPFEGYGALDSPAYGGGALEAYSHATWGGGLPFEDGHEPAHTYFGGLINNTYLDDFWNESFAVFWDNYYFRHASFGDASARKLAFIAENTWEPSYDRVSCQGAGAFAGPVASALGYGKGAKVLQMLEAWLGTERFVALCRKWVATFPRGEVANWQTFRNFANGELQDPAIRQFFADWLDGVGGADLKLTDARWEGKALVIRYSTGPKPLSVPLTYRVEFPDGQSQTFRANVRGDGEIRRALPTKPARVSLDPWRVVLRKADASERKGQIQEFRARRVLRGPGSEADLAAYPGSKIVAELPADLTGALVIAHPDRLPGFAKLLSQAGMSVIGNTLTFRGRRFDLTRHGALAVIPTATGYAEIGIGQSRYRATVGQASAAVFDEKGRFMNGETEPSAAPLLTRNVP